MNKEKIAFIPRQYLAVIAVLLAIMMSVLDGTIMNIALPTLAHDFDVTPSTAIWIVNAYQLVITMTLLSLPHWAISMDIGGYSLSAFPFLSVHHLPAPYPLPSGC